MKIANDNAAGTSLVKHRLHIPAQPTPQPELNQWTLAAAVENCPHAAVNNHPWDAATPRPITENRARKIACAHTRSIPPEFPARGIVHNGIAHACARILGR